MQKVIDPNRLGLVDYKTCQLYLQQCQVVGMQEKISVSCHSLRRKDFFEQCPISSFELASAGRRQ